VLQNTFQSVLCYDNLDKAIQDYQRQELYSDRLYLLVLYIPYGERSYPVKDTVHINQNSVYNNYLGTASTQPTDRKKLHIPSPYAPP
jgi:hypothetical protein